MNGSGRTEDEEEGEQDEGTWELVSDAEEAEVRLRVLRCSLPSGDDMVIEQVE